MDKTAKEREVEKLRELLVGKVAVVLTDYKGMTVEEMYGLRREFDAVGAGYRVVKNTLAKLAIAGTRYEFLSEGLKGTVGVVYTDEPVAAARVLTDFTRRNERLKIGMGYLDGSLLPSTLVKALSMMPGKDSLRAQLLSVFLAPATKFVGVLAAGPRGFIGVLNARKETLGGAAAA